MGYKKNIGSCLKSRRGFGTVHMIVLIIIVSGIVASAVTMTSILGRSLEKEHDKTLLELEENNLFTFVDILVKKETQRIFQEVRGSLPSEESQPSQPLQPDLSSFVKSFCKKGKGMLASLESELLFSAVVREKTDLSIQSIRMEYEYYDHRSGVEQFVPLAEGRMPSDEEIDRLSDIRSSEDVAIRVILKAKDEQGRRTEYVKYYYFDFDDAILQEDGKAELIGGAVFYGRQS
ncbi:MAG: hypothetical protein Q4D77_01435 [Peptostreptococcaceae bacterium]|nr:hypothetical protein [Peptostreptococcaceae bacterium]